MMKLRSPTALKRATDQFNIQPGSNEEVGKIAIGTSVKLVFTAFAATEWLLWSAASKILTNRADLKSRANQASKTLAESAKSLNHPYAPQERIVETGNLFCRRKTKEIIEGPTLTQLVGNSVKEAIQHPINFVQKNPKTICIALSAAAIALYYFSPNSSSIDFSSSPDSTPNQGDNTQGLGLNSNLGDNTSDLDSISILNAYTSHVNPSSSVLMPNVYLMFGAISLLTLFTLSSGENNKETNTF